MRIIEPEERALIAEYLAKHRLMRDNYIEGFIGAPHAESTTLYVFTRRGDKDHMIKFEDKPIVGRHPWTNAVEYRLHDSIIPFLTGDKGGLSPMSDALTSQRHEGGSTPDSPKGSISKGSVTFAVTYSGSIKVISHTSDCTDEDIRVVDGSSVSYESMRNKVYRSCFVWEEAGGLPGCEYRGHWVVSLDPAHCYLVKDLSTPSELSDAVRLLKVHNEWRRGDDTIGPTDPKALGIAIDLIVNYLGGVILWTK